MKAIATLAAGTAALVAANFATAMPAAACPEHGHGYHHPRGHTGYGYHRPYRHYGYGYRHYRPYQHYRHGYGHRRGYGYRHGYGHPHHYGRAYRGHHHGRY